MLKKQPVLVSFPRRSLYGLLARSQAYALDNYKASEVTTGVADYINRLRKEANAVSEEEAKVRALITPSLIS